MFRTAVIISLLWVVIPAGIRLVCKTRAIIQMNPGEPLYIEGDRCSRFAACVSA